MEILERIYTNKAYSCKLFLSNGFTILNYKEEPVHYFNGNDSIQSAIGKIGDFYDEIGLERPLFSDFEVSKSHFNDIVYVEMSNFKNKTYKLTLGKYGNAILYDLSYEEAIRIAEAIGQLIMSAKRNN